MGFGAKLKKARYGFDKNYLKSVRFGTWCRSAYLTFKYVDDFSVFPAMQFRGRFRVKISKEKGAKLIISDRLILERWTHRKATTVIELKKDSKIIIENQFMLGDGIKVYLNEGANLILKGRKNESGCGITGNSTVMVNDSLQIGYDCIIAWDTFLTDCDWHTISGKKHTSTTNIGGTVWIGVGVKVLKGVTLGNGCIVTSNSVVTKGNYANKTMLTGLPAKVVKENIADWTRDMIDQ
jgi:acetyltransferase-like isoleucine patch superfamily enzyme